MDVKNLNDVPSFTTKDGSEIRELLAHRNSAIANQSLAEARIPAGGDAIAIPPGARHKLWNTGADTLRLLCCCAPGYEHEDTVLTEDE